MLEHKIQLDRYGFNIEIELSRECSGFHWKAISGEREEYGQINFNILKKQNSFFIETSFSPTNVLIEPIHAPSKLVRLDISSILPGKWNFKFLNNYESDCTLQFLGAKENSYEGKELFSVLNLKNIGFVNNEFIINKSLDKIFVKKSNYSKTKISIGDFSLTHESGRKLLNDETLIHIESQGIFQNNKFIEISEECNIWSFFTIKFYEV